jgi:nickel-dependent lactate racemase
MATGLGSAERTLGDDEIRSVIADGLASTAVEGKRVLVIVPDHTRTCPIDKVFPAVLEELCPRASEVSVMVALGTHQPEGLADVRRRLGVGGPDEVVIHQHEWDSDRALRYAGCLEEREVDELTGGLFRMRVCVRANRMLFDADHILVIGPVFPHEVVGMSGGAKYLFPGCSGPEVLNFFHWLGAVITNVEIIGRKSTPVREVVERACALVPTPKSGVKMVVGAEGGLHGIWAGELHEAWSAAADLSGDVHVEYLDRPMRRVLSVAPAMYDDLWTAGKCMYKLEPVVADGGELVIYAPRVTEVSYTHGKVIDEVGYHVRDFFLKQWELYSHYPWGVLAHSTHVKGAGAYDPESGTESPRVNVVLATGIPEERCRRINLGYLDPATLDPDEFAGREDEGVLLVPKAGEKLFRLRP